MLTTDQKGIVAEMAIAHAALELGVGVSRPLGDERYDLIFDLAGKLVRVQCKWASRYRDVLVVRCYSARRNAEGLVKRLYSGEEVDAFAAYCADLRRCYFFLFDQIPPGGSLQLRLSPPRNNQERRVRWADRYEFAATLGDRKGAIAQLGERLDGIQEVAGSSPAGSTLI
jgi:PD-(D/E)XK endonuclease